MNTHRRITASALALLVVVPAIIIARSGGPPPRRTGAPGDQTCATAGCHAGTVNPGEGFIRFDRLSQNYTPGVPIDFGIELQGVNAAVHGFQATARLNSDLTNAQAGRWEVVQENTDVRCENGSSRGGEACPEASPVELIQHNQPQANAGFNVRWIPPETDVGPITIYASVNGANGNGSPTGDQIFTAMMELAPAPPAAGPPAIRDSQPVLQAFDNSERLSPGTHIQIFGENLAESTRQWATDEFDPGVVPGGIPPTSLDGVSVMVDNEPAAVSFISPTQVNAVPRGGIGEGPVDVVVEFNGVTSNAIQMTATAVSPAMQENAQFVSGETAYVVALHQPDPENPGVQTFVGPEGLVEGANFREAKPGDIITVFVVGAGTDATYPAGQIPPAVAPLAVPFEVRIGDVVAEAAGVAVPPFVGLFQFNITVPNLPPGDHQITLSINGVDTGQVLFVRVMAP